MLIVVLAPALKMGRHKAWRKIAKRERRRRIRTQLAKERGSDTTGPIGKILSPLEPYIIPDEAIFIPEASSSKGTALCWKMLSLLKTTAVSCTIITTDGVTDSNSVEYQEWLKQQEALELFEIEQITRRNDEENDKWLRAEQLAAERWRQLQEKNERLRLQRLEDEIRLKLEWEQEQERKKKEEERLKEIEEENKKKQEQFLKNLEEFLAGDAIEPPQELLVSRETKPDCELCPFFMKTACCRFGDQCSRNHRYPGISKVLLATNFYSHFGLENIDECDADIMLEYEDTDTYKEYKEFFYDVVSEFEKFGRITQFRVCNNYEKHLRGNTYIEFAELRCAVSAYRALHARWYGGRQLSIQFCVVNSWKNAICGLQSRKRCPKGRSCNFLHVFRNPNNLYTSYHHQDLERSTRKTPPRSWRWSESPEKERPRRRSRSRSREKEVSRRRSRSKEKESPRIRSRSKERRERRRREERDRSDERRDKRDRKISSRRKSSERRRSDRRNS